MNYLSSWLYWLFVGVTTILLFPVAVLLRVVTGPFDRRLRVLHRFTCFWASLYTWFNPHWRVRIQKKTSADMDATYMMISNHQSAADVFVLFRTFFHFKWISKIENFRVPLIGWNMRMNRYVAIDRGSVKGSGEMMRQSEEHLRQGSSLLIFPEGTRHKRLGPFKRGAFELAKRAGVPILPIVLDGSLHALPSGSSIMRGLHRIRIHILDPIPVETVEALSVEDLTALCRRTIADELDQMQGGAA